MSKSSLRTTCGTSLLETVIALFLMSAIMILSFQLFYSSTRWQKESETRLTALWLARSKLEEARILAKDFHAFETSLSSLRGVQVDPQHAQYSVNLDVAPLTAQDRPLYSPSRSFEELHRGPPRTGLFPAVADDRRSFGNSALNVTVTVTWSQDRNNPVRLTALLREPPRRGERITIRRTGNTDLNFGESVGFAASLTDANGRVIEDAVFRWTLVPVSTYASSFQTRDGREAVLLYSDRDINDFEIQPPPGACRLRATAKIEGTEVEATTDLITLVP